MALRVNRTSRIPTSKCYFHKDKMISSFCCDKQCTLPMCEDCKPIHIQEHETDVEKKKNLHGTQKIISYQQAYLKAYKEITIELENCAIQRQKYLQQISSLKKECQKQMNNYFNKIEQQIREQYSSLSKLQGTLNKMEKGSIKTLIFFYAGDLNEKMNIVLPKNIKNYEANLQNLATITKQFEENLQKWNFTQQIAVQKQVKEERNRDYNLKTEQSYSNLGLYSKHQDQQSHRKQPTHRYNYSLANNFETFSDKKPKQNNYNHLVAPTVSIYDKQDLKTQNYKYQYRKLMEEEKLIHEQKKSFDYEKQNQGVREIRDRYLKTQNSVGDLNARVLQDNNKNVIGQGIQQNTYELERKKSFSALGAQKSWEMKKVQPLKLGDYNNFGKQKEQPEKLVSFERRYQKNKKQEEFSYRPLQPSDLETNNEPQIFNAVQRNTRSITETYQSSSKNKKFSLNKQVLSPEEIRLMLEQRMAERSRILASRQSKTPDKYRVEKRSNNSQGDERNYGQIYRREVHEQRYETQEQQRWDTKDSIINQIYQNTEDRY